MIGHRLVGCSLLSNGDIRASRAHFDQAIALYNPTVHRQVAARFVPDFRMMTLSWRALATWMLGYPEAALADADGALAIARELDHAVDLMFALIGTQATRIQLGNHVAAKALLDEGIALADEKGALFWKAMGTMFQGCLFAVTGEAAKAVSSIASAITAYRSTGATLFMPLYLAHSAKAHTDLRQFDDARRCIGEAVTTAQASGDKWLEADIHRISGEVTLLSPERDAAKAQSHFERAVLGTSRGDEPSAALARSGPARRSLWSPCARLRLVHRGLRHAGPEGGESAAGGAGLKGLARSETGGTACPEDHIASADASWMSLADFGERRERPIKIPAPCAQGLRAGRA
jgi:predicted ATPase